MSNGVCERCMYPQDLCKCAEYDETPTIENALAHRGFNKHPQSKEFAEAVNNGGSTDYYKFQPDWNECQDIIESRKMNFSQGNIFKSAFCFNVGRHNATDYKRELNKIVYFAQRELERISK